ncbi:MAG: hypothetical protein IT373_26340 [Polyangiaceae bacterium]|nr:hypothetical protein [Polyangiaceae bacterium]
MLKLRRSGLVAMALTLLAACGDEAGRVDAAPPPPPPPLVHDFPEHTVLPGEEVLGLCRSWTLDNDAPIDVNAVTLAQTEALHHANFVFVPDTLFAGPDGEWPCVERSFSQVAAVEGGGGVLYAHAVGTATYTQQLPPGVAVRLPARARIIGDLHLLNVDVEPAVGRATLTLQPLAASATTTVVRPFALHYGGLAIPPHATSRFSGTCDVASEAPGGVLDARVHYVMPQTSYLGTRVFAEVAGGPNDGELLLDAAGPIVGVAHGVTFDAAIDLAGAAGLRFGCEYDNPRDVTVQWGFGDQEMCDVFGFADAPYYFDSRIDTAQPDGTDGSLQLFTGRAPRSSSRPDALGRVSCRRRASVAATCAPVRIPDPRRRRQATARTRPLHAVQGTRNWICATRAERTSCPRRLGTRERREHHAHVGPLRG